MSAPASQPRKGQVCCNNKWSAGIYSWKLITKVKGDQLLSGLSSWSIWEEWISTTTGDIYAVRPTHSPSNWLLITFISELEFLLFAILNWFSAFWDQTPSSTRVLIVVRGTISRKSTEWLVDNVSESTRLFRERKL